MSIKEIRVPDVGGSHVDVIDILVKPGDTINVDDALLTLESDKASMDVPSPIAGTIKEIKIKKGDKVAEGDVIFTVESGEAETKTAPTVTPKVEAPAAPTASVQTITVPDIGGAKSVDVIEILVKPGDAVKVDDPLLTLESDKATMDVPSPHAGVIESINIKVGDKIGEGAPILTMKIIGAAPKAEAEKPSAVAVAPAVVMPATKATNDFAAYDQQIAQKNNSAAVYAGPAVRRVAQEFGVDLTQVKGSGRKGRIVPEDVQRFVKTRMRDGGGGAGLNLLPWPSVDFAKFGAIEKKPLNKIKRITAQNLHRNWVMMPHVTQFDEADITAMENYRQAHKATAEQQGYKLTPLIFIIKAVVAALKEFPNFNSSLDETGENLIVKKYFNVGVAVDTPNGLVVPVLRDVDTKGIDVLAKELAAISKKAREKGLSPQEMQGGNFTISSLGGIGGTAFTPIINAPEVAILGVSKSQMKPIYVDGKFEPRLMLPLCLSYDHRVIDGADGARFISYLRECLADLKKLGL